MGFTLIELLVVLLIIGIVSAVAGVFVYSGRGNVELNTFTKGISATLRYARSHAVAEKKKYSFIIWKTEDAYGLYADMPAGGEIPPPVIYKKFPSKDLNITFGDEDTEVIRIDFSPYGNSSGGTIEIKSRKGPTWYISVNKITGKVAIKRVKSEG